ncbi:MAG: PIN domain-containing protein [Coriobacteriia bacterium]|nr:PIN domain-containing protein [Coriobacteriia bacterium]
MGKKQEKRRAASYFIDYENVRGAGLNGVEDLRPGDKVVVLYGSKDSALKLGQVQNVLNSPAKVQFIKVETGKHDALDFQLVALMFLKMKKKRDYYIVSKDTGFDFAIHMANARGLNNVYRRETISGAKLETKKLPQPKQTQAPKRLPNPKKARAQQADKQMKEQQKQAAQDDAAATTAPAAAAAQAAPAKPEGATSPAEKRPRRRRAGKQGQPAEKGQQAVQEQPAPEPTPEVTPEQTPIVQSEVQVAPQPEPAAPAQQEQAPEQKPSSRRRRRKPTTSVPKPLKDQYRLDIERVLVKHLGGLPKADRVELVIAGLEQTETKTQFYNFLRSKLGNEQGRAFYNELKGCYEALAAVEKSTPAAAE